ncbi:type II secretion system protein [Thalassotalea piscium]
MTRQIQMYNSKKNQGFTLIELVAVIVLLGVLAAVAAPKFINLSSDANKAALEAMGGTILSSAKLVYGKALVQQVQNEAVTTIDINGDGSDDIEIKYGYPSANRTTGIANALNISDDWAYGDTYGGGSFYVTRASMAGFSGRTNNNIPITRTKCYLSYKSPTVAGGTPTVTYITADC